MPTELIAIALIGLIATAVYASVGFGYALVFIPAATLIIGVEPSVASMLVVGPLVGGFLYYRDTPRTSLLDIAPVSTVSLITLPIGIWILLHADDDLLRVIVGIGVLISIAVERLSGAGDDIERKPRLEIAIVAGLITGLMRGSTSMGGPPQVLYYRWLGGGAWRFRSRMFSGMAASGIPTIVMAGVSGVFNAETIPVVLITLPATAVGMVLGIRIRPLMNDSQLRLISSLLLVATSLLAIATGASVLL